MPRTSTKTSDAGPVVRDDDAIDVSRARLVRRGPARPVQMPLRTLREAAGLSQAQVATKSGLAQPEVSKLENAATLDDRMISTVRRYLAAIGADLELTSVSKFGHRIGIDGPALSPAPAIDASPRSALPGRARAMIADFVHNRDDYASDGYALRRRVTPRAGDPSYVRELRQVYAAQGRLLDFVDTKLGVPADAIEAADAAARTSFESLTSGKRTVQMHLTERLMELIDLIVQSGDGCIAAETVAQLAHRSVDPALAKRLRDEGDKVVNVLAEWRKPPPATRKWNALRDLLCAVMSDPDAVPKANSLRQTFQRRARRPYA